MAKKEEVRFNLGDPEFTAKMVKVYRWVMPVIFLPLAIMFFCSKAYVTGLLFLLVAIVCFPPFIGFFRKIKITGIVKFIVCAILIIAAIYSTSLYV